jgi:peptidoglycan/LPS O-acetylase OafA/YrhL
VDDRAEGLKVNGWMKSPQLTLNEVLALNNGVGPGFEHARIGLSLLILFWHSFALGYGAEWVEALPEVPFPTLIATFLPMFFALSGFLVMGSALRLNSLRTFITFRVLRIIPALLTEISLSALILGPLLTEVPLRDYFSNPKFLSYFGSLIGRVRYELPGLFSNNPFPNVVNGALWTVGPEILCYVTLSFLMLAGLLRKRRLFTIFSLCYMALCIASDRFDPVPLHEILPTKALILSFLAGNILFLYRERIVYSGIVATACGVASLGLIAAAHLAPELRLLAYVAAVLLAYVVTLVGLTRLPNMPLFRHGDYSYGIYIYGFPIQQAVVHFLPHIGGWFNFALALPITLLFAACSWHMIEKPALALRKRFSAGPPSAAVLTDISAWRRPEYAIAVALIAYGLFVADASGVFPVSEHVKGFNQKGGVPVAKPQI